MERIVDFIKKNKADILILLGMVISICTQLIAKGMDGVPVAIIIAIVALAIELIKNGLTENAIKLMSEAIMIILDAIHREKKQDEGLRVVNDELVASTTNAERRLTADDIKVMLRDCLK